MARLLSVNVGHPREIAWRGKTVYTSVWKAPVQGRRLVGRLRDEARIVFSPIFVPRRPTSVYLS